VSASVRVTTSPSAKPVEATAETREKCPPPTTPPPQGKTR
jgi:hypothetical protein